MYNAILDSDYDTVLGLFESEPFLIKERASRKDSWLNLAAGSNSIEIMELLVKSGQKIDDENFRSTLGAAARKGAFQAVCWLIENGADIDGKLDSDSAIVGAIDVGSFELVKLLVEKGACTDFSWGNMNYTPLSYAESLGHSQIYHLLNVTLDNTKTNNQARIDLNTIESYFSKYYGKLLSFDVIKIVSNIEISIGVVEHNGNEPCNILFTKGLSDYVAPVPDGAEEYKSIELMIYLPKYWDLKKIMGSDKYSWPVNWLLNVAESLIVNKTWIGGPSATFRSGEKGETLSENTKMSACLALINADDEFLKDKDGSMVRLYSVYPIYEEEYSFIEKNGVEALLNLFQINNISSILNPARKNVVDLIK
jgi:hypothetical protein